MYARIVTVQVQLDKAEQAIALFRDSVVPANRQQKGFIGIRLFVDRQTGKGVVVSRWQSEADVLASEANGFFQEQNARVILFLTAPPTREIFEIAVEGDA